jgi:peroxiredoxin
LNIVARVAEERGQGDEPIITLTTQLNELLTSRRQNAGWDAAYQEMLQRLNRAGFLSGIIDAGAVFPDFVLPSAEGQLIALADQLALGPVVLGFFRGEWCPFCKLTLEALARSLPEIEAAGARVLALTPETGGLPLRMKHRHNAAFEVLSDVDFGVGLAAGVVFKIPTLYRARLEAGGNNMPLRHGNAAWCLPVPATFILRQDGSIAWRFMDVDYAQRAEPEDIIAALRAL